MKRTLLIGMFLALLTSFVFANEVIKREFDVSSGKKLVLETEIGGDIYIKGTDKDKIEVKAEVYRIDEDDYEINFDKYSSGLTITVDKKGSWRKRKGGDIDFSIKVPHEFDVEVESAGGSVVIENIRGKASGRTGGGSLDFSDIEGDVDFRTMGGSIDVRRATGHLDMETMGGSIRVTDSKVDGKVKTMGGSIRIEDVDGDLDGSTMGGSVTYRNVTGKSSSSVKKPLHIKTMGGQYRGG